MLYIYIAYLLKTGSLDNAIQVFLLAQPLCYMSQYTIIYKYGKRTGQLKIKQTTTTFITYNTNYSEKFVHPYFARLIELGGTQVKQLFNIITMTMITKGHDYYLRQKGLNVSIIKM